MVPVIPANCDASVHTAALNLQSLKDDLDEALNYEDWLSDKLEDAWVALVQEWLDVMTANQPTLDQEVALSAIFDALFPLLMNPNESLADFKTRMTDVFNTAIGLPNLVAPTVNLAQIGLGLVEQCPITEYVFTPCPNDCVNAPVNVM